MSTPTVLVAEDDRAIRELLTHHLEREGFTVVGCSDGHAALRHARGAADLLVLDVGLPGVDGYDVVRTLRREERALPIVLLTARTEEIDRVIGFELGADDYIAKPFSPREVVARVKSILRRSGRARSAAWAGAALRTFGDRRSRSRGACRRRRREAQAAGVRAADGAGRERRRRALSRLALTTGLGIRFQWRRAHDRRPRPPPARQNRRAVAALTSTYRSWIWLQVRAAASARERSYRRARILSDDRARAANAARLDQRLPRDAA